MLYVAIKSLRIHRYFEDILKNYTIIVLVTFTRLESNIHANNYDGVYQTFLKWTILVDEHHLYHLAMAYQDFLAIGDVQDKAVYGI